MPPKLCAGVSPLPNSCFLELAWTLGEQPHQIDAMVLTDRIRTLVALGALECRGDVDDIRAGEIRRPHPSPLTATVG
jgi:hypothetical protein